MVLSRRFYTFFAGAGLLLLAACSPSAEQAQAAEATAAEVALMANHDSLMAKTDQLLTLKTGLGTSPAAVPYLRGLAAADAAMMTWMHNYRAPDSAAAPATRLAYFRQQQQVLAGIDRQFHATIDSATRFEHYLLREGQGHQGAATRVGGQHPAAPATTPTPAH